MIHSGAETGNQPKPVRGIGDHFRIDMIGDGRDQNVAVRHGRDQIVPGKGRIRIIGDCIEQFAHALLHSVRQFAGDDDTGIRKRG